jgi:murein L,D-transpeptidase YafK
VAFFYTPAGKFPKKNIHVFVTLAFTVYLTGLALLPFQNARATPAADVWLSVDTNRLNLAVMQGDTTLKVFENIAIGSNGPSMNKQRDDQTTPLGEFTITEIRRSQRYQLFMAINYPNLDHTERAYHDQRIDASEYRALRYDLDRGRPPPQNTALGGQLGIHGLGKGDMAVHETVNWTNGCIALTNEQLLELSGWVAVGTRVVVL